MTPKPPVENIPRYGFKWYGQGEYAYERFEKNPDGGYVSYHDHVMEVALLNRKIKSLENKVRKLKA